MRQVKENDKIKVHYTGKLSNGEIFDSSLEREPLEFTIGQGMLIPGFEAGVIDMAVNEKKTVEIPFAEAYGDVVPQLIQDVPKSELPEDMKVEVGMGLMSTLPDGQEIPLMVIDVQEDKITVDGNHPLAGKDLVFEIEVLEIAD